MKTSVHMQYCAANYEAVFALVSQVFSTNISDELRQYFLKYHHALTGVRHIFRDRKNFNILK